MLNYTFVPFLLSALNANISESNFSAEYLFDFNQTTVVHRDPLQTTQLTAALICQPYLLTSLYCFLQNVTFSTTLTYQNVNVTEEVSRNHIKSEQWFEIYFNEHGVQYILVPAKSDKVIRSIMKDIANQFNIGGDKMAKLANGNFPFGSTTFTEREETPIGVCTTKHNMHTLYGVYDRNEHFKFQIIPLAMAKHFAEQRSTRIRIEKNRENCEYSEKFDSFLNGMQVNEYLYTMEVMDDKLRMSTTMGVQLPRIPWKQSGSPVFTETMLLNLTNIRSPQTIAQNEYHSWTTIRTI
ncbi:uncharacterized protein [Temnothorax longispinosus]